MGEVAEVPQRLKWVKGDPVPLYPDECEPHTPDPCGYLQWHAWAERMAKTHKQRQCKGCGLWAIWEPKATDGTPEPAMPAPAAELRVRIHRHLKRYPRLTVHEIARALDAAESSVRKKLTAMEADGEAIPETTPKSADTSRPATRWTAT